MTELHPKVVEDAMRLAARSHRNQVRKSSDLPYVAHPASVALILQQAGFDSPNVIAAALLHDVVEDTDVTIEEIRQSFPDEVTEWVAALSETKKDASGQQRPWIDRKTEHIAHAASAPLEARAILLADKLHNLVSMQFDLGRGEDIWSRFAAPRDKIFWYYREITHAAKQNDEQLAPLFSECSRLIDELDQPR